MIIRLAAALALAGTGACATVDQPVPQRGQISAGTCDPSNIQDFVGRQRSPETEAELRESSRAAIVRWVPQGSAITMEFRPDRVTAFLDSGNRIESLSCS